MRGGETERDTSEGWIETLRDRELLIFIMPVKQPFDFELRERDE